MRCFLTKEVWQSIVSLGLQDSFDVQMDMSLLHRISIPSYSCASVTRRWNIKVAQKPVLYRKVTFFKGAQIFAHHLGYFCKKIYQFGHAALDIEIVVRSCLRNLKTWKHYKVLSVVIWVFHKLICFLTVWPDDRKRSLKVTQWITTAVFTKKWQFSK